MFSIICVLFSFLNSISVDHGGATTHAHRKSFSSRPRHVLFTHAHVLRLIENSNNNYQLAGYVCLRSGETKNTIAIWQTGRFRV